MLDTVFYFILNMSIASCFVIFVLLLMRQIFTTASVVWVIIAVAALLTATILYMLTRKELKYAVHIKGNLYRSDIVNVLNYKRLTLFGAMASSLFLLAVALVLITNPQLRG